MELLLWTWTHNDVGRRQCLITKGMHAFLQLSIDMSVSQIATCEFTPGDNPPQAHGDTLCVTFVCLINECACIGLPFMHLTVTPKVAGYQYD